MKIIVACGGTGGHSFPGIAVARELVARGHDVTVWSSGRDIESSVMKAWTGKTFSTGARQLRPINTIANLYSILRCRREIKNAAPDALIAMGSYSSLPPVLAAHAHHVPIYLHEANTLPGRAVEWLTHFANEVALSFAMTSKYLKVRKSRVTGLPVRAEIVAQPRFADVPEGVFTVFITGGSQGAHRVNEIMSSALVIVKNELAKRGEEKKLYVIHQTGEADEGMVQQRYAAAGIPARVNAFEREMGSAFATADVVVCRAGASTCFELALVGKPAFFIPLPSAMRNHQHFNAAAFVESGAAAEGIQDQLTPRAVANWILHRYTHRELLDEMAQKMLKLATPNAAAAVADMVEGK